MENKEKQQNKNCKQDIEKGKGEKRKKYLLLKM